MREMEEAGVRSNNTFIVGIVVGAVVGVFLLLLLAVGGVGFWGWGLFVDQAKDTLNDNPVILQHVGKITEIDTDFIATGDVEDEDVFVFRVKGANGTGVVTAEFVTVDEDTEAIHSGTLRLPSGETFELAGEY